MRAVVLFLVLLIPTLAGAHAVSPRDAALLRQAGELLKAEDYAQARDLLRERLASGAQPPPVLLQALGNALYLSDDLDGAHVVYRRALDADPDNSALCRNLALATYGLERFAESAPLFERAYALAGSKADKGLLYQAATAWMYADNHHEAARVLDAAWPLLHGPDLAWLKLNALVRSQTGCHEAGIRAIHQALHAQPDNRELWYLLADAETLGERYERAAAALEAALRLGHDLAKGAAPSDRLVGLYAGAGLPFLAARNLEHTVGDARTMDRLADLYVRSGRSGPALRALERAQQRSPRTERTRRMALVCYQFGLHSRAMDLFKLYLDVAPGDHAARMLLARTALTLSDLNTARQALLAIPASSDYHETAQEWLTLLKILP